MSDILNFDLTNTDFDFNPEDKLVTVGNPNAKTKTSEVYDMAKVRRVKLHDGFEFKIDCTIGTSPRIKRLTLNPGEFKEVPRSLAEGMIRDMGQRGLCILDQSDPYMSMVRGLETAMEFFHDRGELARLKIMERLGHDDAKVASFRSTYGPYLVNEAKEQIIRGQIEKLHTARDSWMTKEAARKAKEAEATQMTSVLSEEAELMAKLDLLTKAKAQNFPTE